MAAVDPLRAISGRKNYGDLGKLFATAEPHMDQLFSLVSSVGLPETFDRALEFGCGAGRFLPHLEKRFEEIWGVDVSQEMLQLARQFNPRCRFHLNATPDLTFFPTDHFDLVFSFLVLQHLPNEPTIARYLKEFVRILRPNGLAVFQLPASLSVRWKVQPRRRIYRFLRALRFSPQLLQSWNLIPMQLTAVPEDRVRSIISAAGGKTCHVETLGSGDGLMYCCTKQSG